MKFKEALGLPKYEEEPINDLTDNEMVDYLIIDHLTDHMTQVDLVILATELNKMPRTHLSQRLKNRLSQIYDNKGIGDTVDDVILGEIIDVESYKDGWNVLTDKYTYCFNRYGILLNILSHLDYEDLDDLSSLC